MAGLELEATLPFVGHRQWTLSLPRALRLLVVKRPALLKVVERALVKAVWRWQRAEAKRLGAVGRQAGGAVAMTADGRTRRDAQQRAGFFTRPPLRRGNLRAPPRKALD